MSQRSNLILRLVPGFFIFMLSIVWYRPGLILGGGEGGLPFYSLQNNFEIISNAWVDKSIGNPSGIVVSTLPTVAILNILQQLLRDSSLVQMIFYTGLNIISAYGTYALVRKGFRYSEVSASTASVIYVLNPIATYTIWHRFQSTYIILYAFLPLILLFSILAFEKRKFSNLLFLNLVLLFASMSFASLPMTILAWFVIWSYWFFIFLQNIRNLAVLRNLLLTFFTTCLLFVLFHSWWIIPFVKTLQNSPYVVTEAYQQDGNLQTYLTLSDRLGQMSYVLRGIHPEQYQAMSQYWWNINLTSLYILASWLLPILAFYPLFTRTDQRAIYLLGASLFILFSMKGANEPFGFLWQSLFSKIRFLEAFRNPFEKWSILLPVYFAPLVGYAISDIVKRLASTRLNLVPYTRPILIVLLLCILVSTAYPMMTRLVFMSTEIPANQYAQGIYNRVPAYYSQANDYLESSRQNTRLLILPFHGEGITHTWDYGYSGVELSMDLFRAPAISLSTGVQFLPQIADQLEQLSRSNPSAISNLLPKLNINHVLVRSDIDIDARNLQNPHEINSYLKQDPGFQEVRKFEELTIYAKTQPSDNTFFATTNLITTPTDQAPIYAEIIPFIDSPDSTFIRAQAIPSNYSTLRHGSIFISTSEVNVRAPSPEEKRYLPLQPGLVNSDNAVNELPYVKYLPGSVLYGFVRMKENLAPIPKLWSDAEYRKLKLAGKRLVEVKLLLDSAVDDPSIQNSLFEYDISLHKIDPGYIALFPGVQDELLRHKMVMEQVLQSLDPHPISLQQANRTQQYLQELFLKGVAVSQDSNIKFYHRTYKLDVPEEGSYQVHISLQNGVLPSKIIINSQEYTIDRNQVGEVSLHKGHNVISFPEVSETIQSSEVENIRIYAYRKTQSQVTNSPQVGYQKKSPNEYQVQVSNAKAPFVLVFSTAFHPLWQAQINNIPLKNDQHVIANNYANAWLIDQEGDYQIRVFYKGQQYHDLGNLLSLFSIFIIPLTYLIWRYLISSKTRIK